MKISKPRGWSSSGTWRRIRSISPSVAINLARSAGVASTNDGSFNPHAVGALRWQSSAPILAAGRPYVAAVEPSSEVAALTTAHGIGVVTAPGDAAALAAAIIALADDQPRRKAMGARARTAAALFARDRQVAAHAQVLREVSAK